MKTFINRGLTAGLALLLSAWAFSQQKISKVEFVGDKTEIFTATTTSYGTGVLSSGEGITTECLKGTCYLKIDYKGRFVTTPIGETITNATVFEYDFAGDEDKELVVVNEHKGTCVLYVFAYARGIIQKLFEKEIFNNRTVIKKNYIEMYTTGSLNQVWNYYQGIFWEMKPEEF